jgi:hypothetical protein
MRRFAVLGLVLLAGLSGVAILLGYVPYAPPSISADDVTVQHGESTEVQVTIARTTAAQVNARAFDPLVRSTSDAEISPTPALVATSLPPGWRWHRPRDVRISLPIHPTADEVGTYEYTVTASNHAGETNVTRTITVVEAANQR